MAPVVFVTGGTGFVGSTLLRTLLRRGHPVHALRRSESSAAHLRSLPVTWHGGDLADEGSLSAGLMSARAEAESGGRALWVVHAAAVISYRRREDELSRTVNVDGTSNLLRASASVGIDRLCFVSSVVAVGMAQDSETELDEDCAYLGEQLGCAYVTTKRAAEELALAFPSDFEVVVVNPGAIFGRANKPSNTTRFLARAISMRFAPPSPPGSLSVVGVQDVADGILLALQHGLNRRRYLLTESNWTHKELMSLVLAAADRRPSRVSIARRPWQVLVLLAGLCDSIRPFELTSPQALMLLGEHFRFSSNRARTELGWQPQPFAGVLADTLAWMRTEGILSSGPGELVSST